MKNLVAGSRDGLAPARRVRPANRGATEVLSLVLLFAAALSAPGLAYAAHGGGGGGSQSGGGGGFHGGVGGGFHGGGGGGFHAGGIGGLHAGGFRAGGVRNSGLSGSGMAGRGSVGSNFADAGVRPEAPFGAGMDRFHAGSSREGSSGNSIVLRGGGNRGQWHRGWHDGRYGWWWGSDPYLWSNDDIYDDSYANGASDTFQSWYCSDPAGYYPSVSQCNTTWQAVSGN